MRLFFTLRKFVISFLARPTRVFIVCLLVVVVNMIFKGGLLEILNLNQNLKKVKVQQSELKQKIENIDMKILRASDPNYLELEVLNRFDLAQEGDLIFVFSDVQSH